MAVPYGADLLGTLLILVFFGCPVLFALQVRVIDQLVTSMDGNGSFDTVSPKALGAFDQVVAEANEWFRRAGTRLGSAAFAAASGVTTYALFWSFATLGIYGGQLHRIFPDRDQARSSAASLYDGWWMGPSQPVVYWLMITASFVYFYLLYKELFVGVVFLTFTYRMMGEGFLYWPSVSHNHDGYHGMRTLRHFIRVTYLITLVEVSSYFAIFWFVQAPTDVTLVLGLVVVTGPLTFVVLPTYIARHNVIQAKATYIEAVRSSGGPVAEAQKVWDWPNLPFGMRKIASATVIYLVFPTLLVLLTAITKAG